MSRNAWLQSMVMWKQFFRDYRLAKGSGAPSALDPLIQLLRTYPKAGSVAHLDKISAEAQRVLGLRRWFGANPGEKYRMALLSLEQEESAERNRLEGSDSSAASQLEANIKRRAARYAALLKQTKTDPEYFKEVTAAFTAIMADPRFATYMNEEVGWLSATSWFKWAVRSITPAMQAGWLAKDLRDELSAMALEACAIRKPYLEQYLVELSIYCAAAADRADVGVIYSQASTVFGPLIGPLLQLPTGGVLGAVASGSRSVATKLGGIALRRAMVDIPEEERQLAASKEKANLMRFTHAWLKYVTTETPSDATTVAAVSTILAEFGGKRGCKALYEKLILM